jgi:hypothetical protein
MVPLTGKGCRWNQQADHSCTSYDANRNEFFGIIFYSIEYGWLGSLFGISKTHVFLL